MRQKMIQTGLVLWSILLMTSCKKEEKEDPNAPQACFLFPAEMVAGEPVVFTSSCSSNAFVFQWDFGDGGTSQEANPVHKFTEGGEFTVTLIVSDGMGGTDETTQTITVQVPSVITHSGTISEDETWSEGVHLLTGDVYVNGATLTIEPGAVINFSAGSGLYFGYSGTASGATLIAEGTADKPITFTSAAATKSPGDWDLIGFYDGASSLSSMQYCIIEYGGGYSENYGSVHIDASSLSIDHSTVRYSENIGISLNDMGYFESCTENTLEENGGSAISIYGNYAHTIGSGNSIESTSRIRVKADHMEQENVTWLKQTVAYFLDGDFYIGSVAGSTLTLNPGVEVRIGGGSGIYIGYTNSTFGTLKAEGTENEHITITSGASETNRSPGDWDLIGFYKGAGSGSSLKYCDIEYGGGYSANYGMIYIDGASISVTHTTLRSSESMGISLNKEAKFEEFSDNTFEENGTYPIEIYANSAHTIGSGNVYSGSGILVQQDRMENSDVTWTRQEVPYIIDGDIYLGSESGAKLTLEPGTTLKFTKGAGFWIGHYSGTFGVLSAVGQVGNPITFTSSAPAGFESAGDWDGIWFENGTGSNTILENCVVSYGGGYSGNSGNLSVVNENPGVPVVTNCIISHSAAWGIYVNNSSEPSLTGVTYSGNATGEVNK